MDTIDARDANNSSVFVATSEASGRVRIEIYSIHVRKVRTLVDENFAAGRHSAGWDGRDQGGRSAASATYLFTMSGPGIKQSRRMLLMK